MPIIRLVTLFVFASLLINCSEAPREETIVMSSHAPDENYSTVEVYYATDRKASESTSGKLKFGSDRGTLSYGISTISIPREHQMGELEAPSIFRLEFREDPEKHVVVLDLQKLDPTDYFKSIRERVNSSDRKRAFIFVHGYNVSFEDAARRTGQITYDLGFDGAPVFYSWPSEGATSKYTFDENNITWSQPHIENFLVDFSNKSDAEEIYLIAHSMGNRAVTRAYISAIEKNPEIASRFKEVILAAPDIDAQVFKEQIAPQMTKHGRPITLYASSKDIALQASKAVHGRPRAGDSGTDLTIMPGIETIDATNVKSGFLGHSYFAENRSILSDIYYMFNQGLRANKRAGLTTKETPEGTYWEFNE